MIASLRSVRLTRMQLGTIAAVSALATALIIVTALGRTAAQSAALAALRRHPVIYTGSGQPAARASSTAGDTAGASPLGSSGGTPAGGSSAAGGSASSGSGALGGLIPTISGTSTNGGTSSPTHKVGHVFVIALSTTSFDAAFGQGSPAHYLNHTLRPKGTLLGGYQTLGQTELPDYLAMVSGQAPNQDTLGGCTVYSELPAGASPDTEGQVPGVGCVYPNTIVTIGDQVTASGKTWKAYIDDMGTTSCVHPDSGAPATGRLPGAGPQYDPQHNPFIYFHSLLDLGGCASNDVSLDRLPADLSATARTARYTYIAPRACDDASATSCPDGKPAGIAGEDQFLAKWVPRILKSSAYKSDGVLIIAFALAGTGRSETSAPTGALLLSRYAKAGATIATTYDPYSVLGSVEELFGYARLAHAKQAKSFVASGLPGA